MSHYLKATIEQAFIEHVEQDLGLIAGPDRLLNRTVKAVQKWLAHHENLYRDEGMENEAAALRDLRMNLVEE